MSILHELSKDMVWREFLQYKIQKKHLSQKEELQMIEFIQAKKYREVTDRLLEPEYTFKYPVKKVINKSGTLKKRVVYSYDKTESMVLKVMVYLLYRYDNKICDNCFSFRRNNSAQKAVLKVASTKQMDQMYCLKADISNYFNSIPAAELCQVLRGIIDDDPLLVEFLEKLLLEDKAYENGEIICENRGAMAGIPISPFFANIYMGALDKYFEQLKVPYFRYSDDILIMALTERELNEHKKYLEYYLKENGLTLNPDKVELSMPGEKINFLGISYWQGKIDLSQVTRDKLKRKIKRKAQALYKWRCLKHVDFDKTAKVLIRIFNKKFYDDLDEHAFTWSRWFFPLLSSDEGLKELDEYFLMYIRYLSSGRHYKGNYRIRYEEIKALGYRSLVNEYYRFRKKTDKTIG